MSSAVKRESDGDGGTPAKRRKSDDEIAFKENAQNILEKLSNAVPAPFAVSGRCSNAPMITIAIKSVKRAVVQFPVFESEAAAVIKSIEESPYGKGRTTGKGVINAWEINSGGFEILNPLWKDFIDDDVTAKIKQEMCIDFPFSLSLHKLVLYKAGSYFQPVEHSDNDIDGLFAKLMIQLPSHFRGGKLITSRNGKTVASDFSSTDRSNTYSTFFTAFYHHSDQTVSEVTYGYRVCLVYHLITRRSSVPRAPAQHPFELPLVNLIKNWEHPGKLVYPLKHKYAESNLSFDNLKSTDRLAANFLIYIAGENDLCIYLAEFNKESFGQSSAAVGFDFDSDDENFSRWKGYSISKLIATDGTNLLTTSLSVNFDAEVITEDRFKNTDSYRKKLKPNAVGGVDVTRFHSSAAIVFWPKRFLLEVPKKCGASAADLDKIFLKEIETYRGKLNDVTVKTKLKNWAKEIIAKDVGCMSFKGGNKSIDFIKTIIELKDLELIQSLFAADVILNEVSLALMVDVCEKYGWKTFAEQVPRMFGKPEKEDGIKLLARIDFAEMDADKKAIVHSAMEAILDQLNFHPHMEKTMRQRQQDFFLSACRLAETMDFKMLDFAKSKSMLLTVPVLLRLVRNNSPKLSPFWKDVAQHFASEMEAEATRPIPNWRRNDRANCSCNDCNALNAFLASDQVTVNFPMGKDRRKHLEQSLNGMANITHRTQRGGRIGVLVIQKTSQSPPENPQQRAFSIANLPKLRAILPS